MTIHTTVNPQRAAEKLRAAIAECSPHGYTTLPVSLVLMAARAIEQQQKYIDQIEALRPEIEVLIAESMEVVA